MLRFNKVIILFSFLLIPVFIYGQTKEDLKKQKLKIEKEIGYTTELLNKTKNNKTKSLSYLKTLNKQIKNKEELLNTLAFEIKLINKQIKNTEHTISNTEKTIINEGENLEFLKEEYSKMIYAAFLKKGSRNDLMFIISSKNFNQAYKRVSYLKQYSSFRKNQAKEILKSKFVLESKKEQLTKEKQQLIIESVLKNDLVSLKKKEMGLLNNSKSEKELIIKNLSKSEQVFKQQLKDQKLIAKELENKIREIIEEEIRKAREKAEKTRGKKGYSLTPEALMLSSEFASNKGSLPWPLSKGIIVQSYGKQKHPVFSNVELFNNGIDIATDENMIIRSVFDGKVSRIFFINGSGKAILINHGEYFSVYSGLKEILVKTGEQVLSKEKIGVVLSQESEQKTELHFEIWKGYEKQNPSEWLFNAD